MGRMSAGGNKGGRGGSKEGERGGRVKRQQVETDDGWTVITHGVGKMGLSSSNSAGWKEKDKTGLKIAGQMPSHTVEGLTVEKIQLEFSKLQERWEVSDVARQIKDILKEGEMKGKVNEAVCIGIGSFSRDWEHRWRSMWQLVLFQFVIQHLSVSTPLSSSEGPEGPQSSVVAYAQDPAFMQLDIEFLATLNITALDSGIEAQISKESFVYSPFVDWFLLLPMFLEGKDPVLYVGNEVLDDYTSYAQTEEKRGKLGECNALGREFLEGREMVKMREFEGHAHAVNGMVVYTKSPSPAPECLDATTPADVPT